MVNASVLSPLLNNFASMSKQEKADLRRVFDKTLCQVEPYNAVTVSEHQQLEISNFQSSHYSFSVSKIMILSLDRLWKLPLKIPSSPLHML